MEDNIKRITEGLRKKYYITNPVQAAEDRAILSGEYSWIMGQLEIILQRKPTTWNTIRKNVKSDTACERAWEMTSDGLDEMGLKLRAKGIEKMMTGLGGLIKLAEADKSNIF